MFEMQPSSTCKGLLVSVTMVLSACGGGEDLGGAVEKALGRASWTTISSEGQRFTFNVAGTYTVRFGANGVWVQKSIINSGDCSVANFGSDPAPGVLKTCQVRGSATVTVTGTPSLTGSSTNTSTTTSTTTTTTSTWTKVANEGDTISTGTTINIRYGIIDKFVEKAVSGTGSCGASYFGSDPAPGVIKECFAQDPNTVSVTPATATTTTTTTSSSSATTTSGAPSGDGTVVANMTASRVSGTAPLAVLFDATASTITNGNAFHGLRYEFNFGDERAQTWPVSGLPKNTQRGGPIAAHVFDVPGIYNVQVQVTALNGSTSTAKVSIEVKDPSSVFIGQNTVCVSVISDFTGCPTGALTQATLPTVYAGKRVLLRRGDSFPQVSIKHADDNVIVGAYGSGAKPLVDSVRISQGAIRTVGQFADEVTIMDLDITNGIAHQNSGTRHLYYRNDLIRPGVRNNIMFGDALKYSYDMGNKELYVPREIFVVENRIIGLADLTGIHNSISGTASRLAIIGNDVARQREHNVRLFGTHKTFIAHNALRGQSSDGIRQSLKLHSYGLDPFSEYLDVSGIKWASSQVVIANNRLSDPADNNSWTIGIAPQNNVSVEGVEDIILENNSFHRGPNTNTEAALIGRRFTARGNSRLDGGIASLSNLPNMSFPTPIDWQGPYWLTGDWTVATLDPLESLPPTASGTTNYIEWVLDFVDGSGVRLEVTADPLVSATSDSIRYQATLSEEAVSDLIITLSNGERLVIKSGEKVGQVLAPLVGQNGEESDTDYSIQVFVTKVEGGGFLRISVMDSNVQTVVRQNGDRRPK